MGIFLKNCIKYFNTIKYLRFIQIKGQIKRRLYPANKYKADTSKEFELTDLVNNWVLPARRKQSLFKRNTFKFGNLSKEISSRNDWNNPNFSKLWLYNLHYFDDLNAIDFNKRIYWHKDLISAWIKNNKPAEGNGWEPYPVSLRVVNWIKWHLGGNSLEENAIHSLLLQVRFLVKNVETHLLGNHLFSNAKALIFAGIFFSHKESENWYQNGLKILMNELSEQILDDGGSFELSTMYHIILLEDLLDIFNIHNAFNREIPLNLVNKINLMYQWLKIMCHPDEQISFFNDATHNVSPSYNEIKNYIQRLVKSGATEIDIIRETNQSLINLNSSGYSRIQAKNFVLLIDRGSIGPDFLPGHSHADTLSFELSLFDKRVIVNSGISTYEKGIERNFQRGTSAHSTVTIDSQNSSETWGSFRVARRAKIFKFESENNKGRVNISASHDGYHRLKGKPTHSRKWEFSGSVLKITDDIAGKGFHDLVAIFPLHPEIKILNLENQKVFLDVFNNHIEINFNGQGELSIKDSFYYPEFGMSIKNQQLHYKFSGNLPSSLITKVIW